MKKNGEKIEVNFFTFSFSGYFNFCCSIVDFIDILMNIIVLIKSKNGDITIEKMNIRNSGEIDVIDCDINNDEDIKIGRIDLIG